MKNYIKDLLKMFRDIAGGRKNFQYFEKRILRNTELANKYFKEWVVEEPYSLVPNYISPFNIGVKKS